MSTIKFIVVSGRFWKHTKVSGGNIAEFSVAKVHDPLFSLELTVSKLWAGSLMRGTINKVETKAFSILSESSIEQTYNNWTALRVSERLTALSQLKVISARMEWKSNWQAHLVPQHHQ